MVLAFLRNGKSSSDECVVRVAPLGAPFTHLT